MKNRRKAVQPFEIKKRKIDIFRNYEAYGFEKNQRKFENFSTLISKKSSHPSRRNFATRQLDFFKCLRAKLFNIMACYVECEMHCDSITPPFLKTLTGF